MTTFWEEERPSRFEVLGTYSKRALNIRGNSSPYLSGDLYSDTSDFSFQPPKFRRFQKIEEVLPEAKVIFCPSNLLESFFGEYKNEIKAKVIICSNSDLDFLELPIDIPSTVRHLFLQNSSIPNSEYTTTIPIGIENLRWGKNGFTKLMHSNNSWDSRVNKVLVGPFGLTHKDRYLVRDAFANSGDNLLLDLITGRHKPRDYASLMSQYRYVACVRGNGMDTHRHWESIYRGCYPITLQNTWSENFKKIGIPFQTIYEWNENELHSVQKLNLPPPPNPKTIEALWWPYWKSRIETFL